MLDIVPSLGLYGCVPYIKESGRRENLMPRTLSGLLGFIGFVGLIGFKLKRGRPCCNEV